jgi:hypothetical protein
MLKHLVRAIAILLRLDDENRAARIPETVITDTSKDSPAIYTSNGGYHSPHTHRSKNALKAVDFTAC